MKVEYVCLVTMDDRDIRLAAANGGTAIEHPVSPVKTIIKVTTEVREQLIDASAEMTRHGFRVSAGER